MILSKIDTTPRRTNTVDRERTQKSSTDQSSKNSARPVQEKTDVRVDSWRKPEQFSLKSGAF